MFMDPPSFGASPKPAVNSAILPKATAEEWNAAWGV
jgi:hypothetical protein